MLYSASEKIKLVIYGAGAVAALCNLVYLVTAGPSTPYQRLNIWCVTVTVALIMIVSWHARYEGWEWDGVWTARPKRMFYPIMRIVLRSLMLLILICVVVVVCPLLITERPLLITERDKLRKWMDTSVFTLVFFGNIVFPCFFIWGDQVIVGRHQKGTEILGRFLSRFRRK